MDTDIETLIAGRFGKSRAAKINSERYQNDPEYREKIQQTAREWNKKHPEARKKIVKKYNDQNAAAIQKRYREREKQKKNGNGNSE